jgi:hypothetical protein
MTWMGENEANQKEIDVNITYHKQWLQLYQKLPLVCFQFESLQARFRNSVMTIHINKFIEGFAKVESAFHSFSY